MHVHCKCSTDPLSGSIMAGGVMKSTDVHVHVGYPSSIRRHHHCKHNGTDKSSALPLTTTLIKACMLKCDLLRYSAIAIHSSTILNTHTATMTTIAKFNQYRLLAMLIYPICQRTPTDCIEVDIRAAVLYQQISMGRARGCWRCSGAGATTAMAMRGGGTGLKT